MTTSSPRVPDELLALDAVLTEDERDTAATVGAMLDDEVRPHVARWYLDGTLPARDLAKTFGSLGLLGMHLEGYGCAGTTATMYGVACRELEAADGGVRSLVSVQGSLAMYPIHRYGSEAQKQEWLPRMATGDAVGCFGLTEPDSGSDPGSMRTRARRDGSGETADWILDGTKMWITNAPVADVAVIWARGDEGVLGFAVPTDTPGFTAREVTGKMSLRASATGEITLDEVRVPDAARLPEARGLKAPLSCLTEARFGIIWGALGAARDCLSVARDYALSRDQFGRPIGGFQLTQAKLADMVVELQKGQLLALHLARRKDAGKLRPEQVSFGKLNNVREAIAIARQCRTILGANGISAEYPVMRHANNLESVLTYEGTSEIHQLVVGQKLTGLDAFGG